MAIAGNRDLELVFFSLKNQLRILNLGSYLYDEMLIYLSEMCRSLEKLEINSELVTDTGLTQVLIKMTQLKYLDVAACPNFTGLALFNCGEFYGAKDLKRFVLAL